MTLHPISYRDAKLTYLARLIGIGLAGICRSGGPIVRIRASGPSSMPSNLWLHDIGNTLCHSVEALLCIIVQVRYLESMSVHGESGFSEVLQRTK
jgi:hypothetical protein